MVGTLKAVNPLIRDQWLSSKLSNPGEAIVETLNSMTVYYFRTGHGVSLTVNGGYAVAAILSHQVDRCARGMWVRP